MTSELMEIYQLVVAAENHRLTLAVLEKWAAKYDLYLRPTKSEWYIETAETRGVRSEPYHTFAAVVDALVQRIVDLAGQAGELRGASKMVVGKRTESATSGHLENGMHVMITADIADFVFKRDGAVVPLCLLPGRVAYIEDIDSWSLRCRLTAVDKEMEFGFSSVGGIPLELVESARVLWLNSDTPATPVARPTIVCLCGSTRFSEAFQKANLDETLSGRIVLTIGCDMKSDAALFEGKSAVELAEIKSQLDALHLQKIDMADEILVLNVGGYVGKSTNNEIVYALKAGKAVRWLESGSLWGIEYRGQYNAIKRMLFTRTEQLPPTFPIEITYPDGNYPPFTMTAEMIVAIYGPLHDEAAQAWLHGDLDTPYPAPTVTTIPLPTKP